MSLEYMWTRFKQFPNPSEGGYLDALFGSGAYELKNTTTGKLVYIGENANVANRMNSLLPEPIETKGRRNSRLREYILENITTILCRTFACPNKQLAKEIQDKMIITNKYMYN